MSTATEHGLELPQRVRQFSIHHSMEDHWSALDDVGLVTGDDGPAESRETGGDEEDLPTFLRYRSLRRRLDDAYDACYRSNVAHWFRSFFGRQ